MALTPRYLWVEQLMPHYRCDSCGTVRDDHAVYGAYEYLRGKRRLFRHFCAACWPEVVVALAERFVRDNKRPVEVNYRGGARPAWLVLPPLPLPLPPADLLDDADPRTPLVRAVAAAEAPPEPDYGPRLVLADWLEEHGDVWAALYCRLVGRRVGRLKFKVSSHIVSWWPSVHPRERSSYRALLVEQAEGVRRTYALRQGTYCRPVWFRYPDVWPAAEAVVVEAAEVEAAVPGLLDAVGRAAGLRVG